jgi:hypothetical protein
VIDAQKNKLFDHSAEPEQGNARQQSLPEGDSIEVSCKKETKKGKQEKQVNKPDIQYLHDRFIRKAEFNQLSLPFKYRPECNMKNRKDQAVHTTDINDYIFRGHFSGFIFILL